MARWPTRVRSVTKPQEAVLRKLARHPVHKGNLASEPQYFLGMHKRTLAFLAARALVEQVGTGEYAPYALTWRGKDYLQLLDKQRRGERL